MKPKYLNSNFLKISKMFLLMSVLILITNYTNAQTSKKKSSVRMSLDYYDTSDDSRYLIASLFIIEDRVRVPISDQTIYFFIDEILDENLLDSIETNVDGEAKLVFDENYRFADDESIEKKIVAVFKGNDTYKAKSADIEIIGISMELFLSEINDQKTIAIRGYEKVGGNAMKPITDASISFYIPRYFSNQKIGEGDFVDGRCQIQFPENIAGDTIGNISIIAKIEDHENYGNVERKVSNFRWGTTEPIEEDKSLMTIQITIPTRALWHTNAPLWMIITLIVLLAGVWGHYLFVIFSLFKLKNLSKNKNLGQET